MLCTTIFGDSIGWLFWCGNGLKLTVVLFTPAHYGNTQTAVCLSIPCMEPSLAMPHTRTHTHTHCHMLDVADLATSKPLTLFAHLSTQISLIISRSPYIIHIPTYIRCHTYIQCDTYVRVGDANALFSLEHASARGGTNLYCKLI